jgi:transcription elongation factor Elf1
MVKKLTTKLFIERARKIHGDKFDYSITEYEGALLKVKFICKTCGEIIIMIASNHINIRSSKGKACGCYNCFKKTHSVLQSSTNDEFIIKSKAKHGNLYDYSNTKYIHSQQKVEIICSKHGSFIQRPSDHLDGAGCKKCATIKMIEKQRKTNDDFIRQANVFHNNKFDYTCTNYIGAHKEVEIICPKHGKFSQIAHHHLDCKFGCPGCNHVGLSTVSLDWLKIMSFVYNCNIITGLNNKEFKIEDIGKVDGFNYENNLVFEFHGDFWHGNPKIYNMNELNNVSKKTFGELYNKTFMRDLKIIEKGYKLISIWEHDWNLKIKLNKEIINYKLI